MLRTAVASLGLALLAGWSAAWLTEDFQVWTAEGARRLAVASHPMAAPDAMLEGPGLTGRKLRDLLVGPGRATIIGFVYTRCTSVCLALGSGFQQLQRAIATGGVDGVSLLSISFDPENDDETRLREYAARWAADPSDWRIATVPDGAELRRLLNAFQVVVVADGLGGFEHNAALLVVDEHGRLVRIFGDDELDAALAHARSLGRREAEP